MKKDMSNYHDDFSCVAENEFYRPICPLMSYHYPHAESETCKGPGCVFCRDGDCLIAAALERYVITNSPILFYKEDNNIIHSLYEEN